MTREELIKAIDNDSELCPDYHYHCDLPEEEGNTGECCLKCAERLLAEYEARIRAEERTKTIDEIMQKWCDETCGINSCVDSMDKCVFGDFLTRMNCEDKEEKE